MPICGMALEPLLPAAEEEAESPELRDMQRRFRGSLVLTARGAEGEYRGGVAGTAFLLIRHAESAWNASRRWQGLSDSPLSERGRAQARELARALAGEAVDALVASHLARAFETAEILGEALGLAPRALPDLRELDVGAWGGLTRGEIAQRWPEALARFDSGDPDARPTRGESRRELSARVGRAVEELARRHAGGCVAVVTHRGVIAALLPGTGLANAGCVRVDAAQLASSWSG